MSNVKLDIDSLNALELSGKTDTLVVALTGNANFPTPDPTLAVLTAGSAAVAEAYALQKQKESEAFSATQLTEAAIVALKDELRSLGRYVQETSEGDPAKILSSGFAVEKTRAPAQPLTAPGGVIATFGDEAGELDLSWNPLPGRPTYEIYVSESDAAPYRYAAGSTKSKATLSGLTSGVVYHIKIRALNPAGPGAYSNPITQRAA